MRGDEIRNYPHPHAGKVAGAMQQQDRRACAPLQYGCRGTGHLQPSLCHGKPGQQVRAMTAVRVAA
jgi:hypothetical protein